METVSLTDKFNLVHDFWSPKIIGDLNDSYVKVVKLRGEFVWHHPTTQKMSCSWSSRAGRLQLRAGGDRVVGPGEFIIVPRGAEHCPLALTDEVHVVLIEPKTTLNTGNVRNERTRAQLERI